MPEAYPFDLPPIVDLAILIATAETGSVSAAARRLGLAQPNASRSLARLERRLGLSLLRRDTRGSALTADGAIIVDWAREVIEAQQRLVAGAAALRRPSATPLNVAASQTIAEELLPRWLTQLRAEFPGVDAALTVANSAEVGRLIGTPQVLGFVESPDLPQTITVPVTARIVATDRLVVVVWPDHPWARRTRPISVSELASTPLVVREAGSGTRVSFERAVTDVELAEPALELSSNAAVRVAVAAGAGPAVLSELAVRSAVESGLLRAVMIDGLVVERPLRAVWAAGAPLSAAASRLVEIAGAS